MNSTYHALRFLHPFLYHLGDQECTIKSYQYRLLISQTIPYSEKNDLKRHQGTDKLFWEKDI